MRVVRSWYLCRTACRSESLLCWRSRALWDRWLCTPRWPVWDTPHSRYPRQNPLNSSTCPRGTSLTAARHTHPRATSCSTAHYAYLEKVCDEDQKQSRRSFLPQQLGGMIEITVALEETCSCVWRSSYPHRCVLYCPAWGPQRTRRGTSPGCSHSGRLCTVQGTPCTHWCLKGHFKK